jgi:hypothetical protein
MFAEGCLEHKDLTARASMVDLEPDTIKNYTDLKEHYAKLIKPKKMISERGANHFSQTPKKKISKNQNQKKVRCFNCGRNNHTVEECRDKIKKCVKCGFYGHEERNCKKFPSDKGKQHSTSQKDVSFQNNGKDKEVGKWHYAAKTLINKGDLKYPFVYLDTCATFSMTGEKDFLTDIRPWNGVVTSGDIGSEGNVISAIGNMILIVKNQKGEESTIEVPNVRYVENFNVTLIRPQQLWKELEINCDFYVNEIIGPDNRIIGDICEDSMFLPYIKNCEVQVDRAKCFLSKELWHERFGHVSLEYVNIMKNNGLRFIS